MTTKNDDLFLPELLSPAGSPEALRAAVEAGADAVYFGASGFNARAGARNFSDDELKDAVLFCHKKGTRVYLTLNTAIYDREVKDYLSAAEEAYLAGVDALIVADIGGAAALHRTFPDLPLHASTQMAGHNSSAAKMLADLGFSRMVLAREMSCDDIASFTKESPIEAEVFIHGALCVSHSGQCLFSSLVGGRSGNRGECAQPCRLPYNGGKYLLSLKDLCLAEHMTELISYRVASLKIEGRMKSPEYVGAVTSVWRRLIDERRNATEAEMSYLAEVFSRSGFTDGYFKKRIGHEMLGIRTESDKRHIPSKKAQPALRQKDEIVISERLHHADEYIPQKPQVGAAKGRVLKRKSAMLYRREQLTDAAREYFDICYLPVYCFSSEKSINSIVGKGQPGKKTAVIGVALPPVIFDSDMPDIRRRLKMIKDSGINDILLGNIGHIELGREFGFKLHGDFRLNVNNREAAAAVESLSFADQILSPELTLPRIRDIGGSSLAVVYGRIPLMVTEKCVGNECGSCDGCASGKNLLCDRRGVRFPVIREWRHRSLILNSLPTSMSDKCKLLAENRIGGWHFIFTVENEKETDRVISAFKNERPTGDCRRIAAK